MSRRRRSPGREGRSGWRRSSANGSAGNSGADLRCCPTTERRPSAGALASRTLAAYSHPLRATPAAGYRVIRGGRRGSPGWSGLEPVEPAAVLSGATGGSCPLRLARPGPGRRGRTPRRGRGGRGRPACTLPAGGRVPQLDGAVHAGGGERGPVGREGHRPDHRRVSHQRVAERRMVHVGDVPDPHRPVPAPRGQGPAIA